MTSIIKDCGYGDHDYTIKTEANNYVEDGYDVFYACHVCDYEGETITDSNPQDKELREGEIAEYKARRNESDN